MSSRLESQSKFLSLVLRHKPEQIGLTLDANGWADLDELIELARQYGAQLDRPTVLEIVATSDKKRFALNEDQSRIRASQGHSVAIDLALAPVEPPAMLFHGTATRFVDSIREQGLRPGSRQHVHLSQDVATATTVGARHGRAVVLTVDTAAMQRDGKVFYRSENGVWLTLAVPPQYIDFADASEP
ncbi:RNA 2'-phosphotransferase [Silvimonas sp. JCM 19000]